jgi:CBS domain-containing protein
MNRPTKTARQLLGAKRSKGTGVMSVAPGDSILSALKVMQEKDIGAVVVLDGGRFAGILTERDCARKVELQGKTARDTLVRQIMTEHPLFYASPGDSVEECRALMGRHRVRHLPVCDDGTVSDEGRVIGVLSIRDVLEEIIAEEKHVICDLETGRLVMTTDTGAY